jgi:hypothetical protein
MKKKFLLGLILLAVTTVLRATTAHAATMSIVPIATDTVAVVLNTDNTSINAVDVHLTFNPQVFSIRSIRNGGSIVDVWVTSPTFSNTSGTVDLSGIIPGGIVTASGTLVTMTLVPSASGLSNGFALASAQVLLNDGQGTPTPLSFSGGPFTMVVEPTGTPFGSGVVDTEPPDPFTPEIASDTSIFGGQYFLVFSTTDQGSGMAYYQVLEVPAGSSGGTLTGWQRATSPYLLHDQTLSSDIYVRAVDRAGNFRVVELPATMPHIATANSHREEIYLGVVLGILILIAILWFAWPKKAS